MARPKKSEEPPKRDNATLQVTIEDFVRTRDSVVTGLATLQSAVVDLSRAYIAHTNTVLGRAPGTHLELQLMGGAIAENGIMSQPMVPVVRTTSPEGKTDGEDGKKTKKKRYHDPNAPKRPLTPYFLYMQSARPIIARDLGGGVKPGEVSTEGTSRWTQMPEEEKSTWKALYQKNLESYQGRMAAYKRGEDWTALDDQAAAQLAAETGASIDDIDAEEPQNEAPPPPPTTAPKAKRRKTAKENKASAEKEAPATIAPAPAVVVSKTPVKPPGAVEPPKEKESSPEKKKKKATPKKSRLSEVMIPPSDEPAPAATETPEKKKKKSSKKRKSEAVES